MNQWMNLCKIQNYQDLFINVYDRKGSPVLINMKVLKCTKISCKLKNWQTLVFLLENWRQTENPSQRASFIWISSLGWLGVQSSRT